MLLAGVLALACPTASLADMRPEQFDELANTIRQHNGRLTPANADRLGRAALNASGDRRFLGLWRVLNYYKKNADDAGFTRWMATTRAAAANGGDPDLAVLADLMALGHRREVNGDDQVRGDDWRPYLDHSNPNVRRAAQLEWLRAASSAQRWSEASKIGAALISDLDTAGPLAWPMAADAHTVVSYALMDLGDHDGAFDHMVQAATIDRKIGADTQDAERVYDLAWDAAAAGEFEMAERFATLHGQVIRTSGGPNAKFFNRYLCANIASFRGEFPRILNCLKDVNAVVDRADDSWSRSALRLRLEARAHAGDWRGAQADLDRLRATSDAGAEGRFEQLATALILRAQGRGDEAFDAYDQWRRHAMAEQDAEHQRRIKDISAALQTELAAQRVRGARLAREAELSERLSVAWRLIAILMGALGVAGAAWTIHLRRMSRRLKEARDAADAANAAKSTFLATISHELRTPLNGMLGMAQALKLEPLEAREREQVELLEDSGRILLTLLNDVLDLSKIEAGKLEIAPIPGDLVQLCERTVRIFEPLARDKAVVVSLAVDGPPVPDGLVFDPVRVRQCLSNLVSNAVKFTSEGRVEVRLACAPAPDADGFVVTLAVADSGIGMSAETLGKLFGAFVQADASTARKFGGTGLGLNITRHLAEMMGGGVVAESVEGQGSTFTLTFRCEAAQAQAGSQAGDDGAEAPALFEGWRVLLAEDHPMNRKVVALMLEPLGCEITEAENGQAALDALEGEAFDIVLMDVNMPVMDGLEASRRIRADARWDRLPIIALTADLMESQLEACRAAGMDDHVGKPIDMSALVAAIARWAEGRDAAARAA